MSTTISDDDFVALLGSVEEAGAIQRGEASAVGAFCYEGGALAEVVEDGRVQMDRPAEGAPAGPASLGRETDGCFVGVTAAYAALSEAERAEARADVEVFDGVLADGLGDDA